MVTLELAIGSPLFFVACPPLEHECAARAMEQHVEIHGQTPPAVSGSANSLSAADAYESDCQRWFRYKKRTAHCELSLCFKGEIPSIRGRNVEGIRLTYFSRGIATTQLKRDQKATLLASIRAGTCEPSHGMTKDEATAILIQDIADYDDILAGLRRHKDA